METIIKKFRPYGKLYDIDRTYYLASKIPLPPEPWMTEHQQKWLVIPYDDYKCKNDVTYLPYARMLVTSEDVSVEFCNCTVINVEMVVPDDEDVWSTDPGEEVITDEEKRELEKLNE